MVFGRQGDGNFDAFFGGGDAWAAFFVHVLCVVLAQHFGCVFNLFVTQSKRQQFGLLVNVKALIVFVPLFAKGDFCCNPASDAGV